MSTLKEIKKDFSPCEKLSKDFSFDEKLDFKKFEDIPVSTKTFIINTNININTKILYETLPVTTYVKVEKKRGRKKKVVVVDPNKDIPSGSIITLEYGKLYRGVLLKKKKKKKDGKEADFFRNSMTVVIILDNKKIINFKISRNGKFQMTGCKYDSHAEECVKYIWGYIREIKKTVPEVYTFQDETEEKSKTFKAMFIPAMRNIDFSLGFVLDREKLDSYFNEFTEYSSLLEPNIGYTGVNIKFPVTIPITDLKIKEVSCKNGRWLKPKMIDYEVYLNKLKPKEKLKKIETVRYTTFLVFQSSKTILSSMCEEFAKKAYYEFIDIIKNNWKKFQENIENNRKIKER